MHDTRDAIGLFNNDLIVGNHDSITLFGAQSQAALQNYSKAVSKILLRSDDELESAIDDVLSEIERLEIRIAKKTPLFFEFGNRQKALTKEYHRIVTYIERVCLFFQMQQAQLLKEIKLLEKLSITVGESVTSLEHSIEIGERVLSNRNSMKKQFGNRNPFNLCDYEKDMDAWYFRLEHRMDDLRVSHTVALQNQAQIKFLYENNLVLIDRISAAIANTFPIWKNQMVIMLGIERLEKRLEDQDKVLRSSSSKTQPLDIKSVAVLNEKLKAALQETISLEKNDMRIRQEFQENIHYMERG